jgi:tetratricopeptide (TPR) repeat protein/transcriptional regulator with XRE-family HTH domain
MSNNLARLRAQNHLSQQELADLVQTTKQTVSRWERGDAQPHQYNLNVLCKVLECNPEDLGFEDESPILTPTLVPNATPSIYDPIMPLSPEIRLVGRDDDLAHIKAQLCRHDGSVVLSAHGLSGVGKTALATALAYDPEIRAYFSDGILWAALGPTPNIPGLLGRWAALLGLSEAQFARLDEDGKRQMLRAALAGRCMLLILDDVWNVSDALALRVGGPRCASLLTTRSPVIASQMAVPDALLISALSAEDSFALLHRLAPQVVSQAPEQVRALVRAVGGLPLALTLLGNYLRRQAYSGPARRIVTTLERLGDPQVRLQISEPHIQAETHPSIVSSQRISLQSIIQVSDQFLTEGACRAFYALSIFPPKPESFSEAAALVVADCTHGELDELLDAGLLQPHTVSGKGHLDADRDRLGADRYSLHQVIADYARLHLSGQEKGEVSRRLITYITDYVERHKKAYELLEQELSLILYALDRATTDQAYQSQVVPLVCAASPFLLMRGYFQQTQRFLDRASRETLAPESLAPLLLLRGDLCQHRGDLSQALAQYRLGHEIAEQVHDVVLIGQFIHHISRVYWKLGDYQEAEKLLQKGLSLAKSEGQLVLIQEMHKTLAALFANCADLENAERHAREGLSIARQLQDRQEISALLLNLGCSLQYSSPEKRALFEEALLLARAIGNNEQCCAILINLGDVHITQKEFVQAEAYLCEAVSLTRRLGQPDWLSAALTELSMAQRGLGKVTEAEMTIQEALSLENERPRFSCVVLSEVGNLALLRGEATQALQAFQEMHDLCPQGDFEVQALSFYGLSRAYWDLGQMDQARSLGKAALALLQEKKLLHYIEEVQQWYEEVEFDRTCICGQTIVHVPGPGRPRQYCSDSCAARARKRRERRHKGAMVTQ